MFQLLGVHLLWHPLFWVFLFTALAYVCYIMKWQMKKWNGKRINQCQNNFNTISIEWKSQQFQRALSIFVTSLWLHQLCGSLDPFLTPLRFHFFGLAFIKVKRQDKFSCILLVFWACNHNWKEECAKIFMVSSRGHEDDQMGCSP